MAKREHDSNDNFSSAEASSASAGFAVGTGAQSDSGEASDSLSPIDPLALACALVAEPSVTPARGAVFDKVEAVLDALGFHVERFIDGSNGNSNAASGADESVENLLAVRQGSGEHIAFAGHLDVVPAGDGWNSDPFVATIRDGQVYGRGIADMKGAIAAYIAAVARLVQPPQSSQSAPSTQSAQTLQSAQAEQPLPTLSLLLTGDEEGAAIHGTRALMKHMAERAIRPDYILVGEPTSQARLGDMVKIGRRGSVNIWIEVRGQAGHVAYPHLADNPIPRLLAMLAALESWHLDEGNAWFDPSNIEITQIAAGGEATNVIADHARARLSIRFNDLHSGAALVEKVRALVSSIDPKASVQAMISGEAFVTKPCAWVARVQESIRAVSGLEAEPSTSGGTSDARFLHRLAPLVEFGLCNATIHQSNETTTTADIYKLSEIYYHILTNAS